jgi:hypothetical protein
MSGARFFALSFVSIHAPREGLNPYHQGEIRGESVYNWDTGPTIEKASAAQVAAMMVRIFMGLTPMSLSA